MSAPPDGRLAWLDVRKGRVWTGARVPGRVRVEGRDLVFAITEHRHEKKERLAISRIGDERALGRVLSRQPLVLRFPLDEVRLSFPRIPLLGRTLVGIRQEGRPAALITFLDPGSTADPWSLTARVLRRGTPARRERDALRAEIEAALDARRAVA